MSNYEKHNKYAKPKKYTYFSDGNSYDFNPEKVITFGSLTTSMLDMHKLEARHRKSLTVFILDENGKVVDHTK